MFIRSILVRRAIPVLIAAGLFTLLLTLKSFADFTRTGPEIQEEILQNFALYSAWAMARLAFWVFLITSVLMGLGAVLYGAWRTLRNKSWHWFGVLCAAGTTFGYLLVVQFSHHLLYIPSTIATSFLYRLSRLYPLHDQLTPERISLASWIFWAPATLLCVLALGRLLGQRRHGDAAGLLSVMVAVPVFLTWSTFNFTATPTAEPVSQNISRPNIIMIGADTLRADRFGAAGYKRDLTPNIDALAKTGVQFTNFYVPLARTAPSITSLLTGTWPHTHGIRDNYIASDKTQLPVTDLVTELKNSGYNTAVISDWAGADLGKIGFGFEDKDLPEDQWNLKYLIRQGPKDLQLFLSLFTWNKFGKTFLPEVYYLAGTPLSSHLKNTTIRKIKSLSSESDKPFFLTLFTSNTHLPFGSEYPYYTKFYSSNYTGESRFSMSGLSRPSEIIKAQSQDKSKFNIQRIVDLYDGAVVDFDRSVQGVIEYLQASGLMDSTIVVIFSDHGIDLFEKYTWGQGNSLLGDDPSARVPLIIHAPQLTQHDLKVPTTTRSIDLAPTLLEMVGLDIPASMEGKSLLSLAQGGSEGSPRYAFNETGVWLAPIPGMGKSHMKYPNLFKLLEVRDKSTGTLSLKPDMNDLAITARDRMVRDDRWKLIYLPMQQGAEYWLFDTKDGQQGAENVADKYPQELARLKAVLHDWMAQDPLRSWQDEHLVRLVDQTPG